MMRPRNDALTVHKVLSVQVLHSQRYLASPQQPAAEGHRLAATVVVAAAAVATTGRVGHERLHDLLLQHAVVGELRDQKVPALCNHQSVGR